MAITQAVCNSFKRDVLQEGHQIKTDTLKIALFTRALSAGTLCTQRLMKLCQVVDMLLEVVH